MPRAPVWRASRRLVSQLSAALKIHPSSHLVPFLPSAAFRIYQYLDYHVHARQASSPALRPEILAVDPQITPFA
jgi:hypothetical protein